MLQDLLVQKNGVPMAAGTVTCYHDLNRTTLKNWYYLTGSPGNYTYTTLPNPLTLSAAGTIADINGVDTIPFFYPYLETDNVTIDTYYITIVSFDGLTTITRQNFPPFPGNGVSPLTTNANLNNLIVNGGFWRNLLPNSTNVTPTSIPLSAVTQMIVAPSQHDGFFFPDIQFLKNNTSATDILTFLPFPLTNTNVIINDNVPEYYINHVCSAAGSGETQKCYQFPIALHINNLVNVPYTVTIQAQNGGTGSGAASTIQLRLLQYTGTGTSSPSPMLIAQTALVLTTDWADYTLTDVFPPTAGLTLGQGADDAYYLQVWMPFNTACTINFTKPSLYLTQNVVPSYAFETYDQVDSVINSPRTGDIRITANSFFPYGWVPMNDGFIGINNSFTSNNYARANQDVWPLFNLLYQLALPYDTGSMVNVICQLVHFTSANTAININYSGNAYNDFTGNSGNNALVLTKMMGRVLMGTVPIPALEVGVYTQGIVSVTNAGGFILITVTNGAPLFQGQPITFTTTGGGTIPGNIQVNAVYYVTNLSGNTFMVANTYTNAISGTGLAFINSGSLPLQIITSTTGVAIGEYGHSQASTEIGSHIHGLTGQTGTANSTVTVGGASTFLTNSPGAAVTLANTPAGAPFNIVQPATFYNMFIKL
jgi:hypothetical protein